MKNRNHATKLKIQPRVVALFGRARLVRLRGAKYELRGASQSDLTAAKEWVSLFLHEAVICPAPVCQRRDTSNSRWNVNSFGRSA